MKLPTRFTRTIRSNSAGSISIDGADVTELPPRSRDVAMVFQTYALYPHLSVRQNIGYGLKTRRVEKLGIGAFIEQPSCPRRARAHDLAGPCRARLFKNTRAIYDLASQTPCYLGVALSRR